MLMTPAKMCKFTAVVLDTELDLALRLFASLGIAHFIDVKKRSEELGVQLDPVEAPERYYYLSNILSRVTTLITAMKVVRGGTPKAPLAVPEVPDDTYLSNLETQLKMLENEHQELARQIEKAQEAGDKKGKKALEKSLQERANDLREQLLAWEELLQREHRLEETKTLFGKTKRTYVMAGWVPSKNTKKFKEAIAKQASNIISLEVIDYEEPKHAHGHEAAEVAEEVSDLPPTKLTNPKSLKSFETLTSAFGVPNHRELDPSWFMAIGFPLIFGLMFGDIGHGLLLLFFALLGMWAKRKKIDAGEMVNYFIQGSGLIAICALSAIFFGILYGEFLGIDIVHLEIYQALKFSPFGESMKGFLVNLFQLFDFDGGLNWFISPQSPYNDPHHLTPIWFSAFETYAHLPANIASPTWILFVLSIIIGFIHLSIAIAFDAINKLRHKEFKHALFGPIIWLWFLGGLAIMLFTKGINFMDWMTFWDKYLPSGGNVFGNPLLDMVVFIILPLIIMIGGGVLTLGVMEGFMEAIEHLIASISNTISYARILALNMAHAGFAKTFLFLGGATVTELFYILDAISTGTLNILMFILMLLVGTIFVLFMEGLLSFIHALRLHWVEAYLKFYAGTGYAYEPLTKPSHWTTTTALPS